MRWPGQEHAVVVTQLVLGLPPDEIIDRHLPGQAVVVPEVNELRQPPMQDVDGSLGQLTVGEDLRDPLEQLPLPLGSLFHGLEGH